MTAQIPEKFINKYQDISFSGLNLYAVLNRKDPLARTSSGYPFKNPPLDIDCIRSSALWRGYIATYLLESNGQLTLLKRDYPYTTVEPTQVVNEQLDGSFWLMFRKEFFGDSLYVPFERAKIVLEQTKWFWDS